MSLVPILYTSLLIFAVFSIVVISISYISYKVKQHIKKEEKISNATYYQPKQTYGVNTVPVNTATNSIKVVSTIKKPELRKTVELPYYRRRNDFRKESGSDYSARERIESEYRREMKKSSASKFTVYDSEKNKRDRYNEKSRTYDNKLRTGTRVRQNRIEILNKTIPSTDDEPKERYHPTGSGSIALPKYYAGFQAVSYYSEEDDEMFFKPSGNLE